MTATAIPLKPANEGVADTTDIWEAIEARTPPYLKPMRDKHYTQEQFDALPRDRNGDIIGFTHKAYQNSMSREQLESLTQNDKDTIRWVMNLKLVRKI